MGLARALPCEATLESHLSHAGATTMPPLSTFKEYMPHQSTMASPHGDLTFRY